LILPAITLGTGGAATVVRMTRSSMLEVIRQDYILTARSKGISEKEVTRKHMFKNALIPIITAAGNRTATADPQVDRLVEQGRTSVDAAVRERAYRELAVYLADLTNNVNIFYSEINAGGNNKVENFILDPIGYHKLDNVQVKR
jgi:ABC-type transport system substrate-binding protein